MAPARPADFDEATLRQAYRTMLLSRRLDEKMLTLLKQGKGFFHIGCAGHEAAQAAVGLLSRPPATTGSAPTTATSAWRSRLG